jgi:DNA-binding MarR family transcriptional regulator
MESSLNRTASLPSAQSENVASVLSDEGVCIENAFAKLAELRRAMRLFGAFSERISRSAGLSALEYQALLAIRASSRAVTQSLLSRELALGWRATNDLAKRLEQSCLVVIESNAPDRRYRRLVLTDRGCALLASLAQRHLREINRSLGPLMTTLAYLSHRNR